MDETLLLIAQIMGGTLLIFMGWGLYRAGITVLGFMIGCAIGIAVSYIPLTLLSREFDSIDALIPWIVLLVALLLGFINARMFMKIYYFVVFIAGAAYGAAIKINWIDNWPEAQHWIERLGPAGQSPWAEILAALILGLLCVLLQKYLVIVLTVLLGSALIMDSVDRYLSNPLPWLFPALIAVGIVSQLGLLRLFKIQPKGKTQE